MARKSKEDLKVMEGAMGALLSIVAALVALLRERGVSLEAVYRLAKPEGAKLLSTIADAVASALAPVAVVAEKVAPVMREWATWKTVRVGVYKSADEFRKAFKDAGMKLSDWGNDILGKIVFPKDMAEVDVEFVRASNAELGLMDGATKAESEAAGLKLGLEKCMPWDGPAIRLAFKDQPLGEWLLVMMDAITGSGGYISVFDVEGRDDGVLLSARGGNPSTPWGASRVWVFRRKKVLVVKP